MILEYEYSEFLEECRLESYAVTRRAFLVAYRSKLTLTNSKGIKMEKMNLIEYRHNETQRISKTIAKGENFICPICGIRRIAKARSNPNDWYHTGCDCTRAYLQAKGLWIE